MSANTRTTAITELLFPSALMVAAFGTLVLLLLLSGFIISETQYREGVERAEIQILDRLSSNELKDAAMLVMGDAGSCTRGGLATIHTSPTGVIPYIFSRQQRAKGEQIGYDQAITCYRGRLKAMHTVGQSSNWAALMGAANQD